MLRYEASCRCYHSERIRSFAFAQDDISFEACCTQADLRIAGSLHFRIFALLKNYRVYVQFVK